MKILVTYDSFFGNTETIAKTIYEELSKVYDTKIEKISSAKDMSLTDFDLIVVGSPTRGFSPTPDIKAFVKKIPPNIAHSITFGIFDTRMNIKEVDNKFLTFMEKRFGYSNDTIEKILRKKRAPKVHYDKFYVADSEGPLLDGEIERAKDFANSLT